MKKLPFTFVLSSIVWIIPSIFISGFVYIVGLGSFSSNINYANEETHSLIDYFIKGITSGIFITVIVYFLGIAVLLTALKYFRSEASYEVDKERNIKIAKSGEYGNEKFMSDEDIHKYFHCSKDPSSYNTLILGKTEKDELVFINEEYRKSNKNILILGSAGTGKSRAFAKTAVLKTAQRKESIIATDPKGELFAETYKYLEKEGYDVKVLNLKDIDKSDCWNMLDVIINADDTSKNTILQSISEIIVTNSADKKDAFSSAAQSLLTAFLYLFVYAEEVDNLDIEEKPSMFANFLDKEDNTINFYNLAIRGRNKNPIVTYKDKLHTLETNEKELIENVKYSRTISTIYEIISLFNNELVDSIFGGLSNKHPAKKAFMTFSKTSVNLKGNIYQNLANMLQLFSNKELANIFDGFIECLYTEDFSSSTSKYDINEFRNLDLSKDENNKDENIEILKEKLSKNIDYIKDEKKEISKIEKEMIRRSSNIDILSIVKRKSALFIIMNDQNTTYNFLSSIFFNLFFEIAVKYIDSTMVGGEPATHQPINCILDEFANIGKIPDFDKKISTVRSRKIYLTIILQTITQLENLYPNKVHSTILGNCGLTIFLGSSEEFTSTFMSKLAGTCTILVDSESRAKNTLNMVDIKTEYRENRGLAKRELMNPQEVMKKKYEDLYVYFTGYGIMKLKKYYFDQNPESVNFEFFNVMNYIPDRKKDKNQLLSKFFILDESEKKLIYKKKLENIDILYENLLRAKNIYEIYCEKNKVSMLSDTGCEETSVKEEGKSNEKTSGNEKDPSNEILNENEKDPSVNDDNVYNNSDDDPDEDDENIGEDTSYYMPDNFTF